MRPVYRLRGRSAKLAWRAALLVAVGCSAERMDPEHGAVRAPKGDVTDRGELASDTPPTFGKLEYNFGSLLMRGQTLRHGYILKNPTRRPIRLSRVVASTPCCSGIDKCPSIIPPGETVAIPAYLKVGDQPGRRRVNFSLTTDLYQDHELTLGLEANLIPELEIKGDEDQSDRRLLKGRPGSQQIVVIGRRSNESDPGLPEIVEAIPPLVATFCDEAVEQRLADNLSEARRTIHVALPPSGRAGQQAGEIRLLWKDGSSRNHPLNWIVVPNIVASPPGFVLGGTQNRVERTVILRSEGRPFRITAISSHLLAEPFEPAPSVSDVVHTLRLVLDLSRATDGPVGEIRIETDHPDEPTVSLSVLKIPEPTEKPR